MIITRSTLEDGYDYYTIDKWGKNFHFRIHTFPVPPGWASEAVQVIEHQKPLKPYIFQVLSGFDEDLEELEILLKAKIYKGINRRYLKSEDGNPVMGQDHTLAGRIDYNDDLRDTYFHTELIIDGKRITIEKFVQMLQGLQSFNFKFSVHDPSDDIPE